MSLPGSRPGGTIKPTHSPIRAGLLGGGALLTWVRMTRPSDLPAWHGTTILSLRKGGTVVVVGDGQVSMGETIVKSNAKKVRRLAGGGVNTGVSRWKGHAIHLLHRVPLQIEGYYRHLSR